MSQVLQTTQKFKVVLVSKEGQVLINTHRYYNTELEGIRTPKDVVREIKHEYPEEAAIADFLKAYEIEGR